MLTEEQVNDLTIKVNKEVDLPIIGEKFERGILKKAINKILEVLDNELPEELKESMHDLTKGVEFEGEQTLQDLTENTVDFLNKEINIPLIDEKREKDIFSSVVSALFEAMQKDKAL